MAKAGAKKTSKKATKKATTKALSFEEGMAEIEKRIGELEGGELSLEDSIGAYEKAMGALKGCYGLLNQAEGKISMLTKTANDSTLGGEYDIESGTASDDREELASYPDAEVVDDPDFEDEEEDEDFEEESSTGGKLPF